MAALSTAASLTPNLRRRVANRRPRNTISSKIGVSTTVSKTVRPPPRPGAPDEIAIEPRGPVRREAHPAAGDVDDAFADLPERQQGQDDQHEPARAGSRGRQ